MALLCMYKSPIGRAGPRNAGVIIAPAPHLSRKHYDTPTSALCSVFIFCVLRKALQKPVAIVAADLEVWMLTVALTVLRIAGPRNAGVGIDVNLR